MCFTQLEFLGDFLQPTDKVEISMKRLNCFGCRVANGENGVINLHLTVSHRQEFRRRDVRHLFKRWWDLLDNQESSMSVSCEWLCIYRWKIKQNIEFEFPSLHHFLNYQINKWFSLIHTGKKCSPLQNWDWRLLLNYNEVLLQHIPCHPN